MEIKIVTAIILHELNTTFLSMHPVQPKAVANQLHQLREARNKGRTREEIICLVSMLNRYTMVCHPVALHLDKFHGNEASLENKVCFIHNRKSDDCGRGGAGPGNYVWALLDWQYERSNPRRAEYLALGGSPQVRVTNDVWTAFQIQRNS